MMHFHDARDKLGTELLEKKEWIRVAGGESVSGETYRTQFYRFVDKLLQEKVNKKQQDILKKDWVGWLEHFTEIAHNSVPYSPLFCGELATICAYLCMKEETGNMSIQEYVRCMVEHRHPDDPRKPAPKIRSEQAERFLRKTSLIKDLETIIKENEAEMVRRFTYAGCVVLQEKYLKKCNGVLKETPAHMFVRVIMEAYHMDDYTEESQILQCLRGLMIGEVSMASPVLFNAGTPRPQMASCFTLEVNDSMEDISESERIVKMLSKGAGGIGASMSGPRAAGSYIAGTDGTSKGPHAIIPCFQESVKYSDQGGGRRTGSQQNSVDLSHKDALRFITRSLPGKDDRIYYSVFMPDEFFRRLEKGSYWTMFCPTVIENEDERLHRIHGEEFLSKYTELEDRYDYESLQMNLPENERDSGFTSWILSRAERHMASEIYDHLVKVAMESRLVYFIAKDTVNACNMQDNMGTVTTCNLCTEVVHPTRFRNQPKRKIVSVCNLATLCVPTFLKKSKKKGGRQEIDTERIARVMEYLVPAMNRIIHVNYYPVKEAETWNKEMMSIGIGVQGWADALQRMRLPANSEEAIEWAGILAESVHYNALRVSNRLAAKYDVPYAQFTGSAYERGEFHWERWAKVRGVVPLDLISHRYDWEQLRKDIKEDGLANSNVTLIPPTATSSLYSGFCEMNYPAYPDNISNRKTNAGDIVCFNRTMMEILMEEGVLTSNLILNIYEHQGSIQEIPDIPDNLKALFRTLYELSGKVLIHHNEAFQAFMSQAISMSAHIEFDHSIKDAVARTKKAEQQMKAFIVYAWKHGLKTLSYYVRSTVFEPSDDFGMREMDSGGACSSGGCDA